MATRIEKIRIRNYRALADVELRLGPVAVLFGPNGSGKSTLLDALSFVSDCAYRGVTAAAAQRGQGVGLLFDGAIPHEHVLSIDIWTDNLHYGLQFEMGNGRIDPHPGELLTGAGRDKPRIERRVGDRVAQLLDMKLDHPQPRTLRDPDRLTIDLYLDVNQWDAETERLDRLLRSVWLYHSRSFNLHRLKTHGSAAAPAIRLNTRGDNAWSALRNLEQLRRDDRYRTILRLMRDAFPGLEQISFEQTGLTSVYAQFYEEHRRDPIAAANVSDGHLQLLLVLTALFGEGPDDASVILLDEPEISLHPWALTVLAKAIKLATGPEWNRQVLLATHSPVLISQFEPHEIFATEAHDGRTRLRRVSEIAGIDDLLDQYAAGSLYMAEVIGAQTAPGSEG